MQSVVRPLYLLHPSDELAARLRDAQDGAFQLLRLPDWRALRLALYRTPATAVSIVDPCAPGHPGVPARELRELLAEVPSATVLAALEVAPADGEILRTLTAWGIADVIVLGREDTAAALAYRIRAVQGRSVPRLWSILSSDILCRSGMSPGTQNAIIWRLPDSTIE